MNNGCLEYPEMLMNINQDNKTEGELYHPGKPPRFDMRYHRVKES
jgi:hypothetical protein